MRVPLMTMVFRRAWRIAQKMRLIPQGPYQRNSRMKKVRGAKNRKFDSITCEISYPSNPIALGEQKEGV